MNDILIHKTFEFNNLNSVFKHSLLYISSVRVTYSSTLKLNTMALFLDKLLCVSLCLSMYEGVNL